MRRKLIIVFMMVFTMLGLTSCGSKSADPDESVMAVETVQNVDEQESWSEEIEQPSETAFDEASTEIVTEESGENEQDSSEVIWYMDSEGLKSDKLGIVMRNDKDEGRELKMLVSDQYAFGFRFCCNYYNGDIDTYISERALPKNPSSEWFKGDIQKAIIDNVEYAYIMGDDGNSAFVAFVGNGIAVSTEIYHIDEDETLEDYIKRIWDEGEGTEFSIGLCNEFKMNCMAYMTDKGIYSPALGMKFNIDKIYSLDAGYNKINSFGWFGGEIDFTNRISDTVADAKDAQDAVEKYIEIDVNNCGEDKISVGEMETKNWGKYTYYGKEYTITTEFGGGGGHFCSDDTEWYLYYSYYDGTNKDCLDCIESME